MAYVILFAFTVALVGAILFSLLWLIDLILTAGKK
jgi:hypothetical protein